jgi:hypothetical protein
MSKKIRRRQKTLLLSESTMAAIDCALHMSHIMTALLVYSSSFIDL